MKKLTFLSLVLFFLALFLTTSKNIYSKEYNLEEVLSLAKQGNPSIDNISESYKIGNATVLSGKSSALPNLDFSVTGTKFQGSSNGMPRTPANKKLDTTYGSSLTLNQPLITFGRLGSVWDIANLTDESNVLNKEFSTNRFLFQILLAYGEALLSDSKKTAQTKSASHLKSLWNFTQVEYNGGSRNRIDLLRSKSAYEVADATSLLSEVESDSKLNNLKILLNIPKDSSFNLSKNTNLDSPFLKFNQEQKSASTELKLKELQKEIAAEQKTYQRANYFPSLSLFGSVSSTNKKEVDEIFKEENLTYAYGLQFKWNIFSGLKSTAEYREAAANAKIAENNFNTFKKEVSSNMKSSFRKIAISKKIYSASESSQKAAQLAFDKGNSDYRAGTINLTELLDLEKNLLTSTEKLAEAYVLFLTSIGQYKLISGQNIY